jgi:Mg-chelatase subunit ChlD
MSFTHPWLLALLAFLPVFYVLARRNRPAPRGPWPLALWLRLAIAALVVLALAGLRLPAPPKSVATVFVVDVSDSVPADIQAGAKQWVREALQKAGPDDLSAVVTFAREARVELPLGKHRDHGEWSTPPAGTATDLGAALRLAGDLLPPPNSGPVRRIVLLSDGNETAGGAERALLRSQLRDVEVAVRALPQRLQDTAITSFSIAPALREGDPAELRIAIQSPDQQTATLRVWARGGLDEVAHLIYERALDLPNGFRELVVDAGTLPKGSWALRAEVAVAQDSRPENNESWAFTIVGEPARVLLVEGVPGEAQALAGALTAARIQVDTRRPEQVPSEEAALDLLLPYESVILANVHAEDLGRDRMELLRRYVADHGRGLVAIGGQRTFGLGEYADSPLEAALPVTVAPPEKEQVATLALVLLIDRSGSMSATDTADRRTDRMTLAREGAILAVETLNMGDQIGVIAFDHRAEWVSELRTLRGPDDVRAVADQIARLRAEGGTEFLDALTKAYQGLQQTQARVKHVILVTDGEAPEVGLPPLLGAMRRAGITVSTLGVSGDISGSGQAVLERIARAGQGRYYFTNTADDVPQILMQETRLAGRSMIQEREFTPRLTTPASAVRGLVPAEFPTLHGHVRVSPKAGSETVLSSDQGEAVLAQWQYGLGRAVAWTADAQDEWARNWAGTASFMRLWPQAVRWTMRAPLDPQTQVFVHRDGEAAIVRVESLDPSGQFRNFLSSTADIVGPDGTGKRIALPQVAPGRYVARFPLATPGVYFIHVSQLGEDGALVAEHTTGIALPHLPEYQLSPANRILLERLAAESGGPVVNLPVEAWRRDTQPAWQPQDVWNYLIMAALVLFIADVAVRRLRPTLGDVAAGRAAAARLLRGRIGTWRRIPLPRLQLHPLQSRRRS